MGRWRRQVLGVSLLTVTKTFSDRLLLNVSGTAAAVERAFYVNLFNYLRADGTVAYAPDREPSIDLTTPVLFVSNLNNFAVPKPASPGGSAGGGFFWGNDFRDLYASCTALKGEGEVIGLYSHDGFSMGDIMNYATQSGLGQVPPIGAELVDPSDSTYTKCAPVPVFCNDSKHTSCQKIFPAACSSLLGNGMDGTSCLGSCPTDSGCETTGSACPSGNDGEITLDIEMAISMAPAASEIVVFEGGSSSAILHSMISFNMTSPIHQFSTSWFVDDEDPNTTQALLAMAGSGLTFLDASGDTGSVFARTEKDSGLDNVTFVGGTVPQATGSPPTYASETAWPSSSGWIDSANSGLPAVSIPTYQKAYLTQVGNANMASTSFRNEPDIAMPAWFVQYAYLGGTPTIAGTSIAAPMFAGFVALINEQSKMNGQQPVGFLNPALYAMGAEPSVASLVFNDIITLATDADLNVSATSTQPTDFPVGVGYDLVTGLGSPKCGLITQLGSGSPTTVGNCTTSTPGRGPVCRSAGGRRRLPPRQRCPTPIPIPPVSEGPASLRLRL